MSNMIKTNSGTVKGVEGDMYTAFKGIPYAKAPVGELRFKPPVPVEPWDDVKDCSSYGHAAPQVVNLTFGQILDPTETVDEDCLCLNVFVPNTASTKRPVLFYIHGGAYKKYSATAAMKPEVFTSEDIIVVSANYRLGAMGWIDFSEYLGDEYVQSGNSGLLDIIEALKWVKNNIACFGGDPDNICVFGQSSGGKVTSTLAITPAAKGLYSKLFVESGGIHTLRSKKTAADVAGKFLKELGLDKSNAKELLTTPWEKIAEAQNKVFTGMDFHSIGPVADGVTIPEGDWMDIFRSGKANASSLLVGTNRDEYFLYYKAYKLTEYSDALAEMNFGKYAPLIEKKLAAIPKDEHYDDAVVAAVTEHMYGYGAYLMAEAFTKAGMDVWCFRNDFDDRPQKSGHGATLNFLMKNRALLPEDESMQAQYYAMEDRIHDMAISYMKKGSPSSPLFPAWPCFGDGENMMLLDNDSVVIKHPTPNVDPDWPDVVYEV